MLQTPNEHEAVLLLGEMTAYLSNYYPPLLDVRRSFVSMARLWADELEAPISQVYTLHPCTLHPGPCIPAPCTLNLTSCTLCHAPCTLHPCTVPRTLNPALALCILHPAPCTLCPTP